MLGRTATDSITVKDVAPQAFIAAYAEHLKKTQRIAALPNSHFLKTAHGKEMTPYSEDWFYVRAAALARKLYLRPELGVGSLRHIYGVKKRNGNAKNHHSTGSGKVIRYALQQLEKANVLMRYNDKRNRSLTHVPEAKGVLLPRVVTPEGQKELNEIAKQVFRSTYGQ